MDANLNLANVIEQNDIINLYQGNDNLKVYSWGLGSPGALGLNYTNNVLTPKQIIIKEGINSISTGLHTSVFLCSNGTAYVTGCNKNGRIGLGNEVETQVPRKINITQKIIKIACGRWHTLILDSTYITYGTGYNKNGELGLGDTKHRFSFTQIIFMNEITNIFAGAVSFFLLGNKLYTSGKGELNGSVDGTDYLIPTLISTLENENIMSASSGHTHSACINEAGKIFTWGENFDFQLGNGKKTRSQIPKKLTLDFKAVQVSCNTGERHCHTGCVDNNGKAYTWGNGYKAKLGHGDTNNVETPKKIEKIDNLFVVKISCGGIHTGLVTLDGKIMTFGCGSDGRLGHQESEKYRYLYKESYPRQIDSLKGSFITDISCNYYHCICTSR